MYAAEMHFRCILLILGFVFNINSEIISTENEKKTPNQPHLLKCVHYFLSPSWFPSIVAQWNCTIYYPQEGNWFQQIWSKRHNHSATMDVRSFLFNRITWKPQPKDPLLTNLWFDHDWNRNERCKKILLWIDIDNRASSINLECQNREVLLEIDVLPARDPCAFCIIRKKTEKCVRIRFIARYGRVWSKNNELQRNLFCILEIRTTE